MVDFYLFLYFFSFFKQRGILSYAIQTTSEYFICFSINSRLVNLLFANTLSRLANVLGQFPNFINLICGLNNVVYTFIWDFLCHC